MSDLTKMTQTTSSPLEQDSAPRTQPHATDTPLRFRADGTFRVLQMADVQDGPDVSADAIDLIEAAVSAARPDLVVLTGDQIRGYDPAYIETFLRRRGERPGDHTRFVTRAEAIVQGIARPGRRERSDDEAIAEALDRSRGKVRETMAQFLGPIINMDVPFAATYGNHDFQCGVDVDEQDDMYREFAGCLNPLPGSGPFACETGTFALPVRSSDGSHVAMNVALVNSGDYAPTVGGASDATGFDEHDEYRHFSLADSDGYGMPSPRAVRWLGEMQERFTREQGAPVPSIVFQHIPTPDYYQCLRPVSPFTPNAVEGFRRFAGQCYVLDESKARPGSRLGESIACSDDDSGEVSMMRRAGGYFALFTGHDHKNSFVSHIDGIDLGYAPTCGFTAYGPKSRLRGLRLFEFREDNPADYETHMLTYGDLVGERSRNELRVFFGDHLVTSGETLRDELRKPGTFATLAAGLAAIVHLAAVRREKRRR